MEHKLYFRQLSRKQDLSVISIGPKKAISVYLYLPE